MADSPSETSTSSKANTQTPYQSDQPTEVHHRKLQGQALTKSLLCHSETNLPLQLHAQPPLDRGEVSQCPRATRQHKGETHSRNRSTCRSAVGTNAASTTSTDTSAPGRGRSRSRTSCPSTTTSRRQAAFGAWQEHYRERFDGRVRRACGIFTIDEFMSRAAYANRPFPG